ncbi:MAG: ParB/RepB/Spo0J family partition protein [Candidatus Bathyarchaeia archaeon]
MQKPEEKNEKLMFLSLDSVFAPPFCIRADIEADIAQLTTSVKSEAVLEPIIVRPSKAKVGKYEVVCGLRRFLAAQKAMLKTIPCIVKELADREAMEAMLVENMERKNLSDYEVGRWFKLLMERFPVEYPNQTAVANTFGVSQETVSRLISHYEALENIKQNLPQKIMPRGINLPEGIMREIRRATPELQPKILQTVIKNELSARETAQLVKILTVPKFGLKETPKPITSKDDKAKNTTEAIKGRKKPEETLKKALTKYYPADFVDEIVRRFGYDLPSFDKILAHIIAVLDVAWSKIVELELIEEVFREAAAWQKP